jgi:hypothetical protein
VGEECKYYGGGNKYVQILIGNSEQKGPLGGLKHSWEDGIKMQLTERGREDSK